MSTDVLTGVISSTPLSTCGRVLLGKTCLKELRYECLCTNVTRSLAEVVEDETGGTARFVLTLELENGIHEWSQVRKSIDLMGYKADYKVSLGGLERGMEIVSTFPLSKRENADLRVLAESGL